MNRRTLESDLVSGFLKCVNPYEYRELVERPFRKAIDHLLGSILIAIIIMLVLALPWLFNLDLGPSLDKFDTFTIKTDLKTKEPVRLAPGITIDSKANSTAGFATITDTSIIRTPTECLLFEPICWLPWYSKSKVSNYASISNLKDNKKSVNDFVKSLVLLILPSALILFAAFLFLKILITIVTLSLILLGLSFAFKRNTSILSLLKAGMYLSPLYMILYVVALYYPLPIPRIPIIAYSIAFFSISFMLAESKEVEEEK